jgi:hypothetical protein
MVVFIEEGDTVGSIWPSMDGHTMIIAWIGIGISGIVQVI